MLSQRGCWAIELLAVLLEPCNDALTPLTNQPFGKGDRLIRIWCFVADEEMGWVQQKIIGIVSTSLVNSGLFAQLSVDGQDGAPIRDSVLLQQDCGGERLDGEADILMIPNRVCSGPRNLDRTRDVSRPGRRC